MMISDTLASFLRDGVIPPICMADSKETVVDKIGEPDNWKGRTGGIGWLGAVLDCFRDSMHWHYGSVCVSFCGEDRVVGMSLDYSEISKPVWIPDTFGDLPEQSFTLRELTTLMNARGIGFCCPNGSDICVQTESGVAIGCRHGVCSEDSLVNYVFQQ